MEEGVKEVIAPTLVEAYITIRDERAKLKQNWEAQDDELKAEMDQLEVYMLSVCNQIGASSIRTDNGTVIRTVKERFYTNDWDNFKQFVLDNDAVDLFERRIHQKNMKQFLSEHPDDGMPPGMNVQREYEITVRRANSKE